MIKHDPKKLDVCNIINRCNLEIGQNTILVPKLSIL